MGAYNWVDSIISSINLVKGLIGAETLSHFPAFQAPEYNVYLGGNNPFPLYIIIGRGGASHSKSYHFFNYAVVWVDGA